MEWPLPCTLWPSSHSRQQSQPAIIWFKYDTLSALFLISIHIFLNTKHTVLQCNTSLTVFFYLMQITECKFSVQKPTICISEHQTQPFDDKRIYFFLNTKRHSALLYQPAGHDTLFYTYVHQCNNPLAVFLSNANIHKAI